MSNTSQIDRSEGRERDGRGANGGSRARRARRTTLAWLGALIVIVAPGCAVAQHGATREGVSGPNRGPADGDSAAMAGAGSVAESSSMPAARPFVSRRDSMEWVAARARAERSRGYRVIVSLRDRRLWVVSDSDTLLKAPAAVAKGTTLTFGGRSWTFRTPRGVRTVLDKTSDPVWVPPDWLYAEVASQFGLKLYHMRADRPARLSDGQKLIVQDSVVGVLDSASIFHPLPIDEHIVFDNTLFIPPLGTKNRRVVGELGKYRLDLGDGYLLHGTPDKGSIGTAATHGCIRLDDPDIAWLYEHVPVGAKVYIY